MTDKTTDLEARLAAQRLVLEWLLERIATDKDTAKALVEHVDARFPPQDHQEDPGAVPVNAFADFAATEAELRLLLDPVRARHDLLED
ncbi:hypothetical protein FF098_013575 [Parvularcula flava]|uniref:Uncharacterized protein n=1 Tax=Aquisalinus luteolus TaxID=1566827 RepID=A0A8J3A3P8_9PROT|nr:hypothetical protein [Aquisalinus luteolus]NHK28947.1 hypothetical protein [Aquisalinus luteolus]GGI00773.1 hypothetical protein GCM10011355_29860 [Aquisalinus luteolus]